MKKARAATPENSENFPKDILIVAIGASAGGIEAMNQLLRHLAPDTGMAFIYIQHLDPTHESMLADIFSRTTRMPVLEVHHLTHIEPDHVYVIPPNKSMEILDGVLALQPRQPKPTVHMPIDQFFISLAEKQKEKAIGVVLSGAASDGTLGLKAIRIAGGITIAQNETAKFQTMPRSAIAYDVVDMVLPPEKIAKELERLGQQAVRIRETLFPVSELDKLDDDNLKNIIQLLRKSVGVDFTHYKINTIRRRIVRRLLLHKLETFSEYLHYLKQHTAEINLLYNDLLINVTSFFRDPDAIEFIKKTVLPRIIKSKSPNDPIRIWVPACATGEEAYSLAMVMVEVLDDNIANTAVQIFGTDLSESAISKARLGVYSQSELANIPPQQLQRFFTRVDGAYRISKSIRDLCVFAPHNIFRDPPFSRIDLISCCNLLIYLDTVLQKKVLATFHYALVSGGYLMLGKSETVSTSPQLFTQIEKKYKIYARKNNTASQAMFEMNQRLYETGHTKMAGTRPKIHKAAVPSDDLGKAVDHLLLHQYVPACVVVNQELEILHFRGSTSLFLEPLPGKASLNLLKMARPGLAFELRNAVFKSGKSGKPVKKSGLEINYNNHPYYVSIEVTPLKNDSDERLYAIVFEQITPVAEVQNKSTLSRDQRIKQLEEELHNLREDMRAVIEEQEASNEELQSANEEIVSSNEELQSINEELETSKEELEASNEELLTINQELQIRNEQLAESYEYAEAVFTTIREAVLVLDKDLRVISANRTFYNTYRVKEVETEGRIVYEIGNRQWDIPALHTLLEEVTPRNSQFYGFELTHYFPDIGQKILLLNVRKVIQQIHRQQLILLAIEDITEHRQAQQIAEESEERFRNMADNAPVMIWVSDTNRKCTFFNRTWLEYTGRSMDQEVGSGWAAGVHPDNLEYCLRHFSENFEARRAFRMEYRLRRHDGQYRWVLDIGKPMFSPQGEFTGFIGSCTEIHSEKMINEELESRVHERTQALLEANVKLEYSNSELEQYAYIASHDLQEPLRKVLTFSNLLEKRHGEALTDEGKDYINRINISARRMSQLINDLLNFSRVVKQEKTFEKTDLGAVVKNVLDDFDMTISQKKALITVANLPVIEAIPIQMSQLFHNLISNALKFTAPRKNPVITVSAQTPPADLVKQHIRDGKESEYTQITVRDNGIGFDQNFAEQIFVIFQRLHNKQQHAGTGIGLALCRRIANHHGGEIYAESKPNEGAAFHVILPVKQ